MAEQRNRWSWDVTGFDPWKSSSPPPSSSSTPVEHDDRKPKPPLVRRYSLSTSSVLPQYKNSTASKLQRLKDKVKVMCLFSSPFATILQLLLLLHLLNQARVSVVFVLRCKCLQWRRFFSCFRMYVFFCIAGLWFKVYHA